MKSGMPAWVPERARRRLLPAALAESDCREEGAQHRGALHPVLGGELSCWDLVLHIHNGVPHHAYVHRAQGAIIRLHDLEAKVVTSMG